MNCSYFIIFIICRNFWNAFIKRCLSFRSRLQLFAVCFRMRLYTTLATTPDTSLGYLASTKWNQTCQPVWNYLFSPKYGAHFPAKIQKLSSKSNVVFIWDSEFKFSSLNPSKTWKGWLNLSWDVLRSKETFLWQELLHHQFFRIHLSETWFAWQDL